MPTIRSRWPLLVILVLGLALSLFSAVLTPPWQVPDEPQHFQLAQLVSDLGRWPVLSDVWGAKELERTVYESLVRSRFWEIRAHRTPPPSLWSDTGPDVLIPPVAAPPAYYALAAATLHLAGGLDVEIRLLAVRLLSAILGLLELLLVCRLARAAFPGRPSFHLTALAFAGFLPMRVYMTGGANSDVLAALLATAALCGMVASVDAPFTPARGASLGLLIAAALLAKRTTAFLIPLAIIFLVLNRRTVDTPVRGSRWWLGAMLAAACLCAPLAAWMLLRPALSVPGQFWPYPGSAPEGLLGIHPEWLARLLTWEAWTPGAWPGYARSLGIAFASFWGVFGWLTVPLGLGWYATLAVVSGVAGAGLVRRFRRGDGRTAAQTLVLWAVALALLQLAGAAVAQGIPQQGRYLLPAAGAIACCFAAGCAEWLPEWAQRLLPLALGGGMLGLNALAWAVYMYPAFYGG